MTEKLYNRIKSHKVCPFCLRDIDNDSDIDFITVKVNKKYRSLAAHSCCIINGRTSNTVSTVYPYENFTNIYSRR